MSAHTDPSLGSLIRDLINDLDSYETDSEEYAKAAGHLKTLWTLRMEENKDKLNTQNADTESYKATTDRIRVENEVDVSNREERISVNTLIAVGANLAGILLILNYERLGVVASKALGFVSKSRI